MSPKRCTLAVALIIVGLLHCSLACKSEHRQAPTSCEQVACRCTYGTRWITDSDGCRMCSCLSAQCQPIDCSVCPLGYLTDAYGCETCDCKPVLSMPKCGGCPQGYRAYLNDSQKCECKPECPALKCVACSTEYLKDANGCQTCECKPASPESSISE